MLHSRLRVGRRLRLLRYARGRRSREVRWWVWENEGVGRVTNGCEGDYVLETSGELSC